MDENTKQVLIEYVIEHNLPKDSGKIIQDFCSKQPMLSFTVYRGHDEVPIIRPSLWYSASSDINVASNDFAGKSCCVFIIHLQNIPCIDINQFIGDKISAKDGEKEFIFLGGGKFYKNKELTEEGYLDLGRNNKFKKNMFESWYSLSEKHDNIKLVKSEPQMDNVERVLRIIDPDEYDLITSVDDIETGNIKLTSEEKQRVFSEIQKRKLMGGKKEKRKNKKTKRKRTKQKNKKRTKTRKKRRFKIKNA